MLIRGPNRFLENFIQNIPIIIHFLNKFQKILLIYIFVDIKNGLQIFSTLNEFRLLVFDPLEKCT